MKRTASAISIITVFSLFTLSCFDTSGSNTGDSALLTDPIFAEDANATETHGYRQLALGVNHTCVRYNDTVQCWGQDSKGESSPPYFENPVNIAAGLDHACAVEDEGIICWGNNPNGWIDPPGPSKFEFRNVEAITGGNSYTCVLDDGRVYCWGNDQYHITQVPELKNPRQITGGWYHACALDDDGVKCWGANYYNQTAVPPLVNPRQIDAGDDFTCALDDTGVVCWGRDNNSVLAVPKLDNPTMVKAGGGMACAIDSGTVKCWGYYGTAYAVPKVSNPTALDIGGGHACVIDDDGVKCWGSNNYGKCNVPPPPSGEYVVVGKNIVINGSFEEPLITDPAGWQLFTLEEVPGWAVERVGEPYGSFDDPAFELQSSLIGPPAHGNQFAELDSHHSNFSQESRVKIGTGVSVERWSMYEISFWAKRRSISDLDPVTLSVRWAGKDVITDLATPDEWSRYTVRARARNTNVLLEFIDTGLSDTYGVLLDDVTVRKVERR